MTIGRLIGYQVNSTERDDRTMALKINKTPAAHQPTKAEMEERIVVRGTPDQIARAVLSGGAPRREPKAQASAKAGKKAG